MLLNVQIAYGYKSLPNVRDDTLLSIGDLMRDHGLLHKLPWDEGLGRISEKDKRYLKACFSKGQRLDTAPRIVISTIHAAKGREADNVLLTTDSPGSQTSMWRKDSYQEDDETRVFYVGLTRAKEHLHLIHPMRTRGFSIPH
jgi:superfamily I DNA/RNA helicase